MLEPEDLERRADARALGLRDGGAGPPGRRTSGRASARAPARRRTREPTTPSAATTTKLRASRPSTPATPQVPRPAGDHRGQAARGWRAQVAEAHQVAECLAGLELAPGELDEFMHVAPGAHQREHLPLAVAHRVQLAALAAALAEFEPVLLLLPRGAGGGARGSARQLEGERVVADGP